ncbi:hypothetical protein ACFVHW_06655 [Streptomyces sp. NPDC127110]|uniref:hypothetical protein n=1 Tax=Streptomyces sp. NPDC127110 TaxID=3345362 RepID=UPI00362520E4
MTAAEVGHLVKAGLLLWRGGDATCPDVHPDQVAALARRRDLPALLDRHVPRAPDQAAVRLGGWRRRTDSAPARRPAAAPGGQRRGGGPAVGLPTDADADADALAELTAGTFGASLRGLTVPGADPPAVSGEVRVISELL